MWITVAWDLETLRSVGLRLQLFFCANFRHFHFPTIRNILRPDVCRRSLRRLVRLVHPLDVHVQQAVDVGGHNWP